MEAKQSVPYDSESNQIGAPAINQSLLISITTKIGHPHVSVFFVAKGGGMKDLDESRETQHSTYDHSFTFSKVIVTQSTPLTLMPHLNIAIGIFMGHLSTKKANVLFQIEPKVGGGRMERLQEPKRSDLYVTCSLLL